MAQAKNSAGTGVLAAPSHLTSSWVDCGDNFCSGVLLSMSGSSTPGYSPTCLSIFYLSPP